MQPNTVDRQSLRVWLLLAILGAILSIVGWSRVFTVVLVAQERQPPAFEVASVKPNKSGTRARRRPHNRAASCRPMSHCAS